MSQHLDAAEILREQRRHELALELVRKHLRDNPQDAYAQTLAADCLRCLGKPEEAKAAIQQALALNPELAFAHYIHSYVLHDEPKLSLQAAEEALRHAPADADYWARVAELHIKLGKYENARDIAAKGLECDATHRDCGAWHAYALVSLDRTQAALASVGRLLTLYPDDQRVHTVRGWIFLEQRRAKEALVCFREALRINPEESWAKSGLEEALRFSPRPSPGVLSAVRAWFGWGGFGHFVILATTYFGGALLLNEASLPWWLLIPLCLLEIALGTCLFLFWLFVPLVQMLLAAFVGGLRIFPRQRQRDLLILWWVALNSLLAWALAAVTWTKFGYQTAVIISWSLIPFSAAFSSLPGWRHRLTSGLAWGHLVIGHLALIPALAVPLAGDGLTIAQCLDVLKVACLFFATQFQGACETELPAEESPGAAA